MSCAIYGNMAAAQTVAYEIVPCALDNNEECMEITLPCIAEDKYGFAAFHNKPCEDETIQIPNGRLIYAFLVSGFDQNHIFDRFHFYNFAKCIFRHALDSSGKAYVHWAWWNNLLAPYMEFPLHNSDSVPSKPYGSLDAIPDALGLVSYTQTSGPTKAIPPEDYQFQEDAKAVLEVIRSENPDAAIILVGHSMGGDAVIRLAGSMPEDFVIDLLAPIDPVGNRTCLPQWSWMDTKDMDYGEKSCNGANNFTRYHATREDYSFVPPRISFVGKSIGYLYHRWQTESMFPFDHWCPDEAWLCDTFHRPFLMLASPPDEYYLPDAYLFRHSEPRSVAIGQDSTNVQSKVPTSLWSGTEGWAPWYCPNCGGFIDGHGEVVGFRGIAPLSTYAYPVGLQAQGDWPSRDKEQDVNDPDDQTRLSRIYNLRKLETSPGYFETYHGLPGGAGTPFEPQNPDLCMVSDDLCAILANTSVNQSPVADANGPYEAECEGITTTIALDGTGSSDPEEGALTYFWNTDCPGDPASIFDDPTSATPLLTVDTSDGCVIECLVQTTVTDDSDNQSYARASVDIGDTVPPELTVPADITIECDESSAPGNTGWATATDACDASPSVNYADAETPGSCPQEKTITRTWTSTDCCGNSSGHDQTIEVVDTKPPVITSLTVSPSTLWAPNGKMVPVEVITTAVDACDAEPVCSISSIVSNEPDKRGADIEITGDSTARLKSRRLGKGDDRIYSISVECRDARGNSTSGTTFVTVPHDQRKGGNNP